MYINTTIKNLEDLRLLQVEYVENNTKKVHMFDRKLEDIVNQFVFTYL